MLRSRSGEHENIDRKVARKRRGESQGLQMAMEASFSGSGGRHLLYATRTMEIPPRPESRPLWATPLPSFHFLFETEAWPPRKPCNTHGATSRSGPRKAIPDAATGGGNIEESGRKYTRLVSVLREGRRRPTAKGKPASERGKDSFHGGLSRCKIEIREGICPFRQPQNHAVENVPGLPPAGAVVPVSEGAVSTWHLRQRARGGGV